MRNGGPCDFDDRVASEVMSQPGWGVPVPLACAPGQVLRLRRVGFVSRRPSLPEPGNLALDVGHGEAPIGAAGAAKIAGSRMVRPGNRAKSAVLRVSSRVIPWLRIAATRRAS